jgi:Ca2+-transporting ATPase
MRSLADILSAFPQAAATGLDAAAVLQSRERFGANRLTPVPQPSVWLKFLEKFDDPIIRILLAASLLSMGVDLFKAEAAEGLWLPLGLLAPVPLALVLAVVLRAERWLPLVFLGSAVYLLLAGAFTGHTLFEGIAVMVAVLLATGVSFLSEYKSDREFELLNQSRESLQVHVRRGGVTMTVSVEEVVVGDIVLLGTGDEIPADGRLLTATNLTVDQSLMNGESEPMVKVPLAHDRTMGSASEPDCLYRGTFVVDGLGEMLVTEVGDESAFGQLARQLSGGASEGGDRLREKLTISKEPTPLQRKLTVLANQISRAGYTAAAIAFVTLLATGLWTGDLSLARGTESTVEAIVRNVSTLLSYVVYVVVLIVVAVPEGLPMSVTVSLALAMRKMTRANSLVRQLVACETIGSATIICSDKTGTLTQNQMQVERVGLTGLGWQLTDGPVDLTGAQDLTPLQWLALTAAVNSTADLEEREGRVITIGSSTEGALLRWLQRCSIDFRAVRTQRRPLTLLPFSSARKRMSAVVDINGQLVLLVKGAPERLIESSSQAFDAQGQRVALDADMRQAVEAHLLEAASQAMRTLAFAMRVLPTGTSRDPAVLLRDREALESDLTLMGFVAIRDPLRADVPDAIAQCRAAGIKVQMITGDTIETARAIGRDIGLLTHEQDLALTSEQFNALSDDEVKERMARLRILARAQPLDKLRMVRLHQALGEVVAVTGDGTNDAPALKQADVGLAMGKAGTEVAKEASKIVLLDDSFATIVRAVFWGRSLYENIQRFLQFQLTINMSALGISLLAPLFGLKPPFTVLQFLWINVIMDTLAAIALCSEPPNPGLLKLPPKQRDEAILTRTMLGTMLVTASFYIVVVLGLLWVMQGSPEVPGLWAGAGSEWLRDAAGRLTGLTAHQAAIVFSLFVLFQVWNLLSCRSVRLNQSGLQAFWQNPALLGVGALIIVGQVLIVQFAGSVFGVTSLPLWEWLAIVGAAASVLVFAELVRLVRLGFSAVAKA